ncbi:unnamed protein product [Adineta ricciae]|uniref:Spermatogenesis-associated protein 6 N-terminal domain-containing protein n=1 Tax=Adineta ricciae TaxID=249248 RepID=A0A814J7D5_ADIRI|nr:unnamed protein product [Adineta ricciae]CAF1034326.1 unnamed protein product [Adineta ricciae]
MATPTRDYRYSVEFNIHAVDAPGTRLIKQGDIYVNICLLGMHKQSRLMPSFLPMHIDQKLYFDKVFKFCYEPDDVIQRLEREHVLIELIQKDFPTPILLASYEASAKDFLYPYSWDRLEYTGLRRYVLLNRTVEFPGISPSFEFSTSPSVDDVTGVPLPSTTYRRQTKTIRRAKSPTLRPSSSFSNHSANMSRSITSHTISSAVKNDYGLPETKEKLRELAVHREINPIVPQDKTKGRPPFVVRHVKNDLIGRKPDSHTVLTDSLVINDYTAARPDTSMSLSLYESGLNRSQSLSPVLGRSITSMRGRSRSPSPSRRSPSPSRRSPSPRRYRVDDYDDYVEDVDTYSRSPSRSAMSPTLHRDSFRYRYRYSPATDLSGKVIHTLRRNLDHYSSEPWHRYYASYGYTD